MKIARFLSLTLVVTAMFCSCSQDKEPRRIAPLNDGLKADALTDCTVAADFRTEDFDWEEGTLNMTVLREDLYDAVEVSQLKVGDTLIYESKPMVVTTIADENGTLSINGGLEEGGCWLEGYEGGTYRSVQFDDHSTYTKLGKAKLPLSQDLVIIDCGENPDDSNDTILAAQRNYIEALDGYRQSFTDLNTRVVIMNGLVKEIHRKWIP